MVDLLISCVSFSCVSFSAIILPHDNEVTGYKCAGARPMSIHKKCGDLTSCSIATSKLNCLFYNPI